MKKKIFGLLFGLIIFSIAGLSFACSSNDDCSGGEECNSFSICKCPTGQKKIDGQCKLCSNKDVCCGVKLNTDVPFIGNCIELGSNNGTTDKITEQNAFPTLVAGLTKLLMTVILIVCFLVLIVAGVLWTTGDAKKGKDLIKGVAIALALLGASGVILRLVNPNFFG